jgi:hypothetical protein
VEKETASGHDWPEAGLSLGDRVGLCVQQST